MLRSIRVILAIILVIGINLLSTLVSARLDLTEGKVYTLSDSTKQITSSLQEDIQVKVFISDKLPSQAEVIRQQLVDKINDYESLSNGKIKVSYQDPSKDESVAKLVQMLGIPELQLQVIEKDQRQVVRAYIGLALIKEKAEKVESDDLTANIEKVETIPVIQDLSTFEYDFTAALLKISMDQEKTIGFLEGHEEHSLSDPQGNRLVAASPRADYGFAEILNKNYVVQSVNISEKKPEITGIDTLVIAGPKTKLADYEWTAIKNFLASGGNVVLLADRINAGQGLQIEITEEDFAPLLSEYGISVEQKLIADASQAPANFSQGFITYTIPYPLWIKTRQENINKENSITGQVESFVLPWANPLTLEEKESITKTVLATTSEYYALVEGDVSLNPQSDFGITKNTKDKLPVVVLAEKEGQGKLLVVGDSDFAANSFTGQFEGNSILFSNIIDGLTLGDALISIRSKGLTDRPLSNLSEIQKNIIRWGNTILIPLLFIVYGLIRRHIRNEKKKFLTTS